jgi:hypothetical protein
MAQPVDGPPVWKPARDNLGVFLNGGVVEACSVSLGHRALERFDGGVGPVAYGLAPISWLRPTWSVSSLSGRGPIRAHRILPAM